MTSSLSVAELVGPFRADPGRSAVFSDFDGTLAAIVDDPAAARPLPGVVDVLGRLASLYDRVGVISGRPAAFLREQLGGRGLYLSGLYGLELVSDHGDIQTVPEAERWRAVVDEVADRARDVLEPGLAIEGKGLSVTVHYRTAPAARPAAAAWAEREAAATGLVAHPGRMSYELHPPVERDKGSVLAEAAEGRSQVCFLGDDRGDLTAYDTLDRMAGAGVVVVRVGVVSPEAPEELLARADLVVEGPEGSLSFLRALLDDPVGPEGRAGP